MNLGKLESLERRLGSKEEAEVAEEIETLHLELRAFRREHSLFRERAHAALDATIAEAGQFAAQLLDSIAQNQGSVTVAHSLGNAEPPAFRAACFLALSQPAYGRLGTKLSTVLPASRS